jgi:hypothetical protein
LSTADCGAPGSVFIAICTCILDAQSKEMSRQSALLERPFSGGYTLMPVTLGGACPSSSACSTTPLAASQAGFQKDCELSNVSRWRSVKAHSVAARSMCGHRTARLWLTNSVWHTSGAASHPGSPPRSRPQSLMRASRLREDAWTAARIRRCRRRLLASAVAAEQEVEEEEE